MSLTGLKLDETDDEFFGTLESRSNLANLFGAEPQIDASNQSLKYKPTKQAQNTAEQGKAWNVKVAKVVTAFKLVNQNYSSQGRVGLAVLSNAQNEFRVIVYRTKTNVLATKTLGAGVKLTFKSSYLQFHDDLQEFWSVFLETNDEKAILEHLPPDYISTVEEGADKEEPEQKLEPEKKAEPTVLKPDPQSEPASEDSDPTTKAKLLSRMARMGQPLPKLATTPQTTTDMSDSSDTEIISIPPKPSIVPRKVTKSLVSVGNPNPSSSLVTYAAPIQETQYMNMILTENRTQNTEIRMNLSKLETKIEKVLDKIELLGSDDGQRSYKRDKDDEILTLEEKILELRKENRSLRQNVRELEAKVVPEKREKKWQMGDDDKTFSEVLTCLDIRLRDCKDLDDDNMELLKKAIYKMGEVETDLKKNEQNLLERGREIMHLNEQIATLQNELKDFQEVKRKAEELERVNEDLAEQFKKAETESKENLQTTVKQIMNNLYADLATTIDASGDSLSKETVLRLCGDAMRKQTINALKKYAG